MHIIHNKIKGLKGGLFPHKSQIRIAKYGQKGCHNYVKQMIHMGATKENKNKAYGKQLS